MYFLDNPPERRSSSHGGAVYAAATPHAAMPIGVCDGSVRWFDLTDHPTLLDRWAALTLPADGQ